jgi:hypothetical protein
MAFRDWLIVKLGGDRPVGDPDAFVEAALVDLWQSELIRTALAEESIAAHLVAEASAQATREHLRPMARVMTARRDRLRALEVIVAVQRGEHGEELTWPPRHEAPWAPPRSDGAVP